MNINQAIKQVYNLYISAYVVFMPMVRVAVILKKKAIKTSLTLNYKVYNNLEMYFHMAGLLYAIMPF